MIDQKKKFSLVKPTVETPFQIDFDWWKETDSNWRIFLLGFLCEKHKETFYGKTDSMKIDAIDKITAEVHLVDGLLYTLMNHCAREENFIPKNLPLIGRIFRIFLANGNKPLTPNQLSEMAKKSSQTILATISGNKVYKGIRPIQQIIG
jgi:hypothetical protein